MHPQPVWEDEGGPVVSVPLRTGLRALLHVGETGAEPR